MSDYLWHEVIRGKNTPTFVKRSLRKGTVSDFLETDPNKHTPPSIAPPPECTHTQCSGCLFII